MKTKKIARNAAALAVIVSAGLTLGNGIAAADTGPRSFPGCPLLLEDRSTGDCVIRLQNDLNAVNEGYHLDPDGTFGADTRIAVLDFQGRNPPGADGNVGAVTADQLSRQAAVVRGEGQEAVAPPVSMKPERRGDPGGVVDTGKSGSGCFSGRQGQEPGRGGREDHRGSPPEEGGHQAAEEVPLVLLLTSPRPSNASSSAELDLRVLRARPPAGLGGIYESAHSASVRLRPAGSEARVRQAPGSTSQNRSRRLSAAITERPSGLSTRSPAPAVVPRNGSLTFRSSGARHIVIPSVPEV